MSSTPIVITTSVDLAGIEGYKTAIKGVETSNAEAAASFNAVTGAAAQQAARFVQSGMSEKEAEGALIGLGYSAKEAAASMEELTGAQAKSAAVADAQAAAEGRAAAEAKQLEKQLRAAAAAPSSTVHNHIHVEMHNHGGKMNQDDVVGAVKQAIRNGSLP